MAASLVAVVVEATDKRAFASALDWPGWCRAGRDDAAALEALAAYRDRYAAAVASARVRVPAARFDVVERLPGTATTTFGAPDVKAARDRDPMTAREAARLASLVDACWTALDVVVRHAPAELRKGPRGGGRDRDPVFAHVLNAERAYAAKIGVRFGAATPADRAEIAAARTMILDALGAARSGEPPVERGWPPRYAARRIAWHVLDHAWEIEDRSTG